MKNKPNLFKNGFIAFLIHLTIPQSNCQSICAPKPVTCNKTEYRSYDGYCNNLDHPEWGSTFSPYGRLLPPNYGDGVNKPNLAQDGTALPNARKVSYTVYPYVSINDPSLTLNVMQYGQILAHDISMTIGHNQTAPESDQCCSADGKLLAYSSHPKFCYQIIIPPEDPVFRKFRVHCIRFSRTGTDREYGCGEPNKPVQQVNSFIDLSLVYGNTDDIARVVRLYKKGKLKYEERLEQHFLPADVSAPCKMMDPKEPCYLAGDSRVNVSPHLVIMQTILLREHNRIAETLTAVNPKWKDEKIFQEARKINIGQHQKIVYNDLLPYFLGKENMLKRKLIYKNRGFVNDYNSTVNPTVLNEFATAVYRFFHSNIPGYLQFVNEKRQIDNETRISDNFNRPRILETNKSNFDQLTRGLVTQHQERADEYHDLETTVFWGRPPGKNIGKDLKALSIQRGRDHGLATYNDFREYCGLPRAKKFKGFLDAISEANVKKLRKLYKTPEDVDATVGGSLEKLIPNTLAGPTFLCILTEQFYRTRVGDRFFFENKGARGFTLNQLKEIKKASISRLICDNTYIKKIQPDGFLKISPQNKLDSCKKLPSMNLHLWKE